MIITPNMPLKVWNLLSDMFDHSALADNWGLIANHDHTDGNGVPIPTGGIASGAITTAKIASQAVTADQIANNTITDAQVKDGHGISKFTSGPLSAIPEPAYLGRGYYATDTNQFLLGGSGTWWPQNLTVVTANADYTVSDGQVVVVNAPVSITLPNPVMGAIVGVTTTNSVTHQNPMSIVVGDGVPDVLIFGPGMRTGSTFYFIGHPHVQINLLISDGANWFVITGGYDTGWLDLPLGAGMAAESGTYSPQSRAIGDLVFMRGRVQNVSGSDIAANTTLLTTGMPGSPVVIGPSGGPNIVISNSTGALTLTATLVNGGSVPLDSISYSLY